MPAFLRNLACDLPRALVATAAGGLAGFVATTLGSPRTLMALVRVLVGAGGGGAPGLGVDATPIEAAEAVAVALVLVLAYGAPAYRWLQARGLAGLASAAALGAAPGIALAWWFGASLLGPAIVNPFVIYGMCIGLAYHLLASR
ncbi:MAG: hypothetical protein AB7H88_19995 [Vicinamibacterales bacterium]